MAKPGCSGFHIPGEPAVGTPAGTERHGWLEGRHRVVVVPGHPAASCTTTDSRGSAHLLYQNHSIASLLTSFTSLLARQGCRCTPSSLTCDLQLRKRQAAVMKQKELSFSNMKEPDIYSGQGYLKKRSLDSLSFPIRRGR